MKNLLVVCLGFVFISALTGCRDDSSNPSPDIVVNSLEDRADPPAGEMTLRAALARAAGNQAIVFDRALDGATIELSIIGEDHTVLPGEVMGMREEASGPVSYLEGYFDRDYGRSALYARKDVIIDASDLPSGITLAWVGGDENPARVLAVYGDLTLINVSITGGNSVAEDISVDNDQQPWTLARGGGVAVWGRARLEDCAFYANACAGDFDSSRDRGAFGGGVYADVVSMDNCIVSGNTVVGGGAAGGGVYSVGGAGTDAPITSRIARSSISGNRISGLFVYGGGVYSDGGGIGKRNMLEVLNTTVAHNMAEPASDLPPFLLEMGYWRGGGIYMSNGFLRLMGGTVVENQVHGMARTDSLGKANLAGGVAATIGNAHAVEEMRIGQSIIAGNTVHETGGETYAHDVFTGSVLHFRSGGYNRIGVIDFSQILVPVGEPDWASLSRRHYPKAGDADGIDIAAVLDLDNAVRSADIVSAGVDTGEPAVLYYRPRGSALDRVPASAYTIDEIYAEYAVAPGGYDNFPAIVLDRIEAEYNLSGFAADFTADFEAFLQTVDADEDAAGVQPYVDPDGNAVLTLADTQWFGPAVTWPKEPVNYPYIEFWHRLDTALTEQAIPGFGPEVLGDDAWATLFSSGVLVESGDINLSVDERRVSVPVQERDQLGNLRPANSSADIGAVEVP